MHVGVFLFCFFNGKFCGMEERYSNRSLPRFGKDEIVVAFPPDSRSQSILVSAVFFCGRVCWLFGYRFSFGADVKLNTWDSCAYSRVRVVQWGAVAK